MWHWDEIIYKGAFLFLLWCTHDFFYDFFYQDSVEIPVEVKKNSRGKERA